MVEKKVIIMPIKGHEIKPMCRNCRHWKRGEEYEPKDMVGACMKRSDIGSKTPSYVYSLPNGVCEQFEAWHCHLNPPKPTAGADYAMLLFFFPLMTVSLVGLSLKLAGVS